MKFFVGDLLACPVCKSTKLLIHPIEVIEEETKIDVSKIKCKHYCHYKRMPAENISLETCKECIKKRIKNGVIICLDCGRWYPILDTIAVMLDDDYRDKRVDSRFIREYYERIPEDIRGLMKIPPLSTLRE